MANAIGPNSSTIRPLVAPGAAILAALEGVALEIPRPDFAVAHAGKRNLDRQVTRRRKTDDAAYQPRDRVRGRLDLGATGKRKRAHDVMGTLDRRAEVAVSRTENLAVYRQSRVGCAVIDRGEDVSPGKALLIVGEIDLGTGSAGA